MEVRILDAGAGTGIVGEAVSVCLSWAGPRGQGSGVLDDRVWGPGCQGSEVGSWMSKVRDFGCQGSGVLVLRGLGFWFGVLDVRGLGSCMSGVGVPVCQGSWVLDVRGCGSWMSGSGSLGSWMPGAEGPEYQGLEGPGCKA